MVARRKSRCMVLDHDDRVIGVISLSDLALVEDDRRFAETIRGVTTREAHA